MSRSVLPPKAVMNATVNTPIRSISLRRASMKPELAKATMPPTSISLQYRIHSRINADCHVARSFSEAAMLIIASNRTASGAGGHAPFHCIIAGSDFWNPNLTPGK